MLFLRLARLYYKLDGIEENLEDEAEGVVIVSRGRLAALNFARQAIKAVKCLERNQDLQKHVYAELLRQLVRTGQNSPELINVLNEIQLKFYFQEMRSVYDMEIMEVMGELKILQGHVQ